MREYKVSYMITYNDESFHNWYMINENIEDTERMKNPYFDTFIIECETREDIINAMVPFLQQKFRTWGAFDRVEVEKVINSYVYHIYRYDDKILANITIYNSGVKPLSGSNNINDSINDTKDYTYTFNRIDKRILFSMIDINQTSMVDGERRAFRYIINFNSDLIDIDYFDHVPHVIRLICEFIRKVILPNEDNITFQNYTIKGEDCGGIVIFKDNRPLSRVVDIKYTYDGYHDELGYVINVEESKKSEDEELVVEEEETKPSPVLMDFESLY